MKLFDYAEELINRNPRSTEVVGVHKEEIDREEMFVSKTSTYVLQLYTIGGWLGADQL